MRADSGKVRVRLGESHDKRDVIGAGDARELLGGTRAHVVIPLHQREQVGRRRIGRDRTGLFARAIRPGGNQPPPRALEVRGGHRGAIVERRVAKPERERARVVRGLLNQGGLGRGAERLPIERHQGIEDLRGHLEGSARARTAGIDGVELAHGDPQRILPVRRGGRVTPTRQRAGRERGGRGNGAKRQKGTAADCARVHTIHHLPHLRATAPRAPSDERRTPAMPERAPKL